MCGSAQLLYAILFKQDSYRRVILNVGLSYYLSSLGNGYVTFGFQEGGLNLLEMRAPSKQIRLIKMGRISLCPVEMVFAPHSPDLHLLLHKAAQTEKKADI